MVLLKKSGHQLEHIIARALVSPLAVPEGWNRGHGGIGLPMASVKPAPEGLSRGFQVLSMLRLKDDAANIENEMGDIPEWLPKLEQAYHDAEGRLSLQGLPLQYPELPELLKVLTCLQRPYKIQQGSDCVSPRQR